MAPNVKAVSHLGSSIRGMTIVWEQRQVRPFWWGAIFICDSAQFEPDDHDFSQGGPVWATPDHVAVATVHARAVAPEEAAVELVLQILDEPTDQAPYTAVINVPSGKLNIGDADGSRDLQLHPGRWRLEINVDTPLDPSTVEIALSPVPNS